MTVAVNNESGDPVDERLLSELAQFVLEQMHVHPLVELSIMAVDEATMSHLHEQFMGEEGSTDVLAFPMDELRPVPSDEEMEPGLLGDVVLCPSVASAQAKQAGHPLADEMNLLCTHGILHLLGYDHHTPEDEREMFGLQARLVSAWRKHAGSKK
ncbi:MAG TPA: rRNA maturation RNase YbeY [Actinomycetes bacterium]|nr:rRNA maturation RNase YbeY [Actinomycetes bacterium]